MNKNFGNKFRAFTSAFDIQQNIEESISIDDIESMLIDLYYRFPELELTITKTGINKFDIKFILEGDDIEILEIDSSSQKNLKNYVDKVIDKKIDDNIDEEIKQSNKNIIEDISISENDKIKELEEKLTEKTKQYNSIRSKNANLSGKVRKLEREVDDLKNDKLKFE